MSAFLIIGGTGKVGQRLTRILRNAGHDVRVASRSSGDVHFNWTEPGNYQSALHGVDGVFLIGPGSATDWSPLLRDFLAVALRSGVGHVVFLSARGVEFLPDGAVGRAEAAIKEGPLPWTILRPTHFAQNFTEAMFRPVDGIVLAPVGTGGEPFVDIKDIAEVAANVLTSTDWINETIEISGPDAIDFDEAASIISTHARRRVAFTHEDRDQHIDRLRSAGIAEGYITWRMAMLDGIRRGDDAYLSDGTSRVLDRPATPFPDWARREAHELTTIPVEEAGMTAS